MEKKFASYLFNKIAFQKLMLLPGHFIINGPSGIINVMLQVTSFLWASVSSYIKEEG